MPGAGNTIPATAETPNPLSTCLPSVSRDTQAALWARRARQEIASDNGPNAPLGESFPPAFGQRGSDVGQAEVITSDKDGSFDKPGALLGAAVQGG